MWYIDYEIPLLDVSSKPFYELMRYLINDQLYPYEIKFGHSGVAYIGISSLIIFYLYGIYE